MLWRSCFPTLSCVCLLHEWIREQWWEGGRGGEGRGGEGKGGRGGGRGGGGGGGGREGGREGGEEEEEGEGEEGREGGREGMKKEEHNYFFFFHSIDLCRHYIVNNDWFEEDQLLKNVDVIRHIPATIVQGRFDTITPMKAAWELHKVSAVAMSVAVVVLYVCHGVSVLTEVARGSASYGSQGWPLAHRACHKS